MNSIVLDTQATLFDAVRTLEKTRKSIVVVLGEEGKLLGTISDGDIRRALLSGKGLESLVTAAMNKTPLTAGPGLSDENILALLRSRYLEALPLVDKDERFIRVVHVGDLFTGKGVIGGAEGFATGIIMAGGEGQRLRPLTNDIPKSMLPVGGMPVVERQVRTMAMAGITSIFIAVNYLGDLIERHIGDGSTFGASVHYLREHEKLGTAGALSLLPQTFQSPVVVINGDVITTSNYGNLLRFHLEQSAAVTVGAVDYRVEIPYGVLQVEGICAVSLEEKPSQRFLCNAGIYVLSPEVLSLVPRERFYNMTDLIKACFRSEKTVAVFPIHEYWNDIGTPSDLARACEDMIRIEGCHHE